MSESIFSLDENTQLFNQMIFNDIGNPKQVISCDISADSVFQIAYNKIEKAYTLSSTIKDLEDIFQKNYIMLGSNSIFSVPTGFEAKKCSVIPLNSENVNTRLRYKANIDEQNMISSMYMETLRHGFSEVILNLSTYTELNQQTIELLENGYNELKSLNCIFPAKGTIITVNSLKMFILSFCSMLEKLRRFQCTMYFKSTKFSGSRLFYNTINIYPELPAYIYNEDNTYYSAVLTSPLAKYYNVKKNETIDESGFLKDIFTTTDSSKTSINAIDDQHLVYIDVPYDSYESFDLMSFDGTNGEKNIFTKITTSTYDLKSQIQDIFSIFQIDANTVISSKKVKKLLLYIIELWQRNLQTFQIDIYTCHYNCHINSVLNESIPEKEITDIYYTIKFRLVDSTFKPEILDDLDFVVADSYYRFVETDDVANGPIISLVYPIYNGLIDIDIPLLVRCTITNLYKDSSIENSKLIETKTHPYTVKRGNIPHEVALKVTDGYIDNRKQHVNGKDINSHIILPDGFKDHETVLSCPGNLLFEFISDNSTFKKIYDISKATVSPISPDYIYETKSIDEFEKQPDYINMRNREVLVNKTHYELKDYKIEYSPSMYSSESSSTISIWWNYEFDDNPGLVRLSNYISTFTYDGTQLSSIEIPDEDAFTTIDGVIVLRDNVYPQFECRHQFNDKVGENTGIVTITPTTWSYFDGSITINYTIKQLTKLYFDDKETMLVDWSELTKSEINEYYQGRGPFTPGVEVFEKSSTGTWIKIPEYMYTVSYPNNMPDSDTSEDIVLEAIVTPTEYGKIFYEDSSVTLNYTVKPKPSTSQPDEGDLEYKFNFAYDDGTNGGKEAVSFPAMYGFVLDHDGANESNKYGGSFKTCDANTKLPDKSEYRGWTQELTTKIPNSVVAVRFKVYIGRQPWDEWYQQAAGIYGTLSIAANGQTIWTTTWTFKVKKGLYNEVDSGMIYITPKMNGERTKLTMIASPVGKNDSAQFIAVAVHYAETNDYSTLDAILEKFIPVEFDYEVSTKAIPLGKLNEWKTDPNRTYQNVVMARYHEIRSMIVSIDGNTVDAKVMMTAFPTMERVYARYAWQYNGSKYYNDGWKITIESELGNVSTNVKYTDKNFKTTTLSWPNIDNFAAKIIRKFVSKSDSTVKSDETRDNLKKIKKVVFKPTYNDSDDGETEDPIIIDSSDWGYDSSTQSQFTYDLPYQENLDTKRKITNANNSLKWYIEQLTFSIPDDMGSSLPQVRYCEKFYILFNSSTTPALTATYATTTEKTSPYIASSKITVPSSLTRVKFRAEKSQLDELITLIKDKAHYPTSDGLTWKTSPDTISKSKRGLTTGLYAIDREQFEYENELYTCIGWTATYLSKTLEIKYVDNSSISIKPDIESTSKFSSDITPATEIKIVPIIDYGLITVYSLVDLYPPTYQSSYDANKRVSSISFWKIEYKDGSEYVEKNVHILAEGEDRYKLKLKNAEIFKFTQPYYHTYIKSGGNYVERLVGCKGIQMIFTKKDDTENPTIAVDMFFKDDSTYSKIINADEHPADKFISIFRDSSYTNLKNSLNENNLNSEFTIKIIPYEKTDVPVFIYAIFTMSTNWLLPQYPTGYPESKRVTDREYFYYKNSGTETKLTAFTSLEITNQTISSKSIDAPKAYYNTYVSNGEGGETLKSYSCKGLRFKFMHSETDPSPVSIDMIYKSNNLDDKSFTDESYTNFESTILNDTALKTLNGKFVIELIPPDNSADLPDFKPTPSS